MTVARLFEHRIRLTFRRLLFLFTIYYGGCKGVADARLVSRNCRTKQISLRLFRRPFLRANFEEPRFSGILRVEMPINFVVSSPNIIAT